MAYCVAAIAIAIAAAAAMDVNVAGEEIFEQQFARYVCVSGCMFHT